MAQRAPRALRERYQRARNAQILYLAATNLWRHGVPMPEAISIVSKAMKDAGEV